MIPRELEANLERYARDGVTGQIVIHIKQGRVTSIVPSEHIEVIDTRARVPVESP